MTSCLHNTKIGESIIDSIPHCHNEYALKRGKNQEMWLRFYIEDKTGVSSIVFHTVLLKMLPKTGKNKDVWLRFYIIQKIGVPIIDSIPHCHTENALKRDKNQEMWLRCYIEGGFVTI